MNVNVTDTRFDYLRYYMFTYALEKIKFFFCSNDSRLDFKNNFGIDLFIIFIVDRIDHFFVISSFASRYFVFCSFYVIIHPVDSSQ